MAKSRSRSASSRSFGLVIGLAFVAIGVWKYESGAWSYLIAVGIGFLLVAGVMPRLLRPAKTLWLRLGQLLGRFLSPVMLLMIYALSIVPIGLLLKLFRKDSLHRAHEPKAESYWITRNTPGPDPASLKNQF